MDPEIPIAPGEKMRVPTFGDRTGQAAAAFTAAALGLLTLSVVQVATFLNKGFQDWVFDLGKLWIPNAEGIGPYSGKETLMLVGWAISWAGLHLALRHRAVNIRVWFGAAMAILLLAVILIWPPVWHWLE